MADKAISELVSAEQITATDMFVTEQNGTAKKITGQVLLNWLTAAADGHGGIQRYALLKTEGLVKTYRFTLADQSYMDIQVTDGRGISSITKTGTSGLVDTYRISYTDGTSGTFTVTNGAKGDKGDNSYLWIKYASQEPTAGSHSFGDLPDDWIGVYWGTSATAPTDWQQYKWFKIKGEKGDTGDPARLTSSSVEYQVSDSGTVIPSGAWSSSVPVVAQGRYLWTRITQNFNTGSPVVAYSVSRMGIDGSGSVSSVAGISPNPDGNIPLTAENVGALSSNGGAMSGELNMNGQPISGLNAPTANDHAANMGFVNQQVKNAAPYNYLHNSDFTQFVAQAGIGGNHGTQAYAGDRWILDSGTVTGSANANGNGYSNIQLNGTIRQIVANPPEVGTVAVEMVSGTATAVYGNGTVTITSSGGVIKNIRLFNGNYTAENMPAYQSKGYGVELVECLRIYHRMIYAYNQVVGVISGGSKQFIFEYTFPISMRIAPTGTSKDITVTIRTPTGYSDLTSGNGAIEPTLIEFDSASVNSCRILLNFDSALGTNNVIAACAFRNKNGYIEFSADL